MQNIVPNVSWISSSLGFETHASTRVMIVVQTLAYIVMTEDVRLVHDRIKMSVCQQQKVRVYASYPAINVSQSPLGFKRKSA